MSFSSRAPVRLLIVLVTSAIFSLALPVLAPGGDAAQSTTEQETLTVAQKAADWIMTQQATDGGFVGFSGTSDPGATTDAIIALAAAGRAGATVDPGKAMAYLEDIALVYTQTNPASAAKLALTLSIAGENPEDFAQVNPLSIVKVMGERGLIGTGFYEQGIGILAIAAAGQDVPAPMIDVLAPAQFADGSWAFDPAATAPGSGDTNTTGLLIQALKAAGRGDDPMVYRAADYLLSTQDASGGFPYQPGSPPDANSTALALQGLIAAGRADDAGAIERGLAALTAFQNESGAFRYMDDPPDDNLFATVQALPAVLGYVLPIPAETTATASTTS